jgi:hypothetical protein
MWNNHNLTAVGLLSHLERRLRVFENRVLRGVFVHGRKEVTGD